jgi:membrane-associated protease RseP (regulator of RpoE activity)
MDAGLIGFIIFVVLIGIGTYLKRDKVERQGIIFLLRTKKLRNKIKDNALKHKKFWNIYFNVGVVVSIFFMFFGIWYILKIDSLIFFRILNAGFGLFLPSPTSSFSVQPGMIFVPIWYWLIAIIVLMVPHEFSHALAFAINKIKIKSLGLILLLFIPGAFAEPDEKQLNKVNRWSKLQVFCAGSFSNIITAIVLVVLLNIFLVVAYNPTGIYYSFPLDKINKTNILGMDNLTNGLVELKTENATYLITNQILEEQKNKTEIIVFKDWPAARSNLSGTIKQINNITISSPEDVRKALSYCKPYDKINILTSTGNYNITLADNGGKPYLGISPSVHPIWGYNPVIAFIYPMIYQHYEPKNENFKPIGNFLMMLFYLLILVCFCVGMFNMLPMKPLDGGHVLKTLTNNTFTNYVSMAILLMILFGFVGPYIMQLF